MIGMILVTHGKLAEHFIDAMEHVVGKQEHVATICIGPNDDMEQRRADIANAIKSKSTIEIAGVENDGVDIARLVRAVDLPQFNSTWAVVLDAPVATINAPLRQLTWALVVGAAVILFAVLAALYLATRFTVALPLKGLVGSVEDLSAGRYEAEIAGLDRGPAAHRTGALARRIRTGAHAQRRSRCRGCRKTGAGRA